MLSPLSREANVGMLFAKANRYAVIMSIEVHMGNLLSSLGLPNPYPLQKALFDKYGPADKRKKKAEKTSIFRVDGCEIHTGADGNPLSHVCTIFVEVDGDGSLTVRLS